MLGLLSECLESRRLLAADMIAVAGGTIPENSWLAGAEVSAFQIAKYEVTWSEWQDVRAWGSADGRTYDLGSSGTGAAASNPVESLTWYDAVKWCNAKSEKDGLQPVYTANGAVYRSGAFGAEGSGTVLADGSKNGYRLPDRSEWEWAARGGASSKGYSHSGGDTISDVAWYQDNSNGGAQAVGTKAANELGIHDMSGNAEEWCWNEFTDAPISLGNFSYINGGSWADNDFVCSFASPGLETKPTFSLPGLRLARNSTVVVNNGPTDITLSAASVAENQASGTTVGSLTTTDPDAGNTFTYTLVTGTGSTDNASFTISGNQIRTAASFNFETKSSYSVRVRSTDQGGLFTEKVFTITVTNVNETPTDITLSAASVAENQASGTTVGSLTTTDPDAGNTFTYTLVTGTGSTDNASFTISGNQIRTAASFNFETKSSYSVRVRSTDQGGLFTEKVFTISVTNVNESPFAWAPTSFTAVTEDVAGNLVWPSSPAAFTDVDSPSLTVTLAVADGTLSAATGGGVTVGGTTTARTFAGTAAALSSYFSTAGNIKYTPAANNTVARALTTTVSDGTLSASQTSTIAITPVNDAPTMIAPVSFTVTEDVASNLVWPASPAAFADVDSPSLTVTLAVNTGMLTLTEATGIKLGITTLSGMTQTARTVAGTPAALNTYFATAGNVRYTTATDDTSGTSLLVGVSDGALQALKICTIAVTPVNDAPTATAPATFTVLKNVASNLVWPSSGPEPAGDIDSDSLTVTLAVADGTLSAKPSTGITIGGTATARTLAGTAEDLSAYLRLPGNVQYTTKFDNTVARTLTTTVSDGTLSTSKTSTISINAFAPTATAPLSFTVTEDVAGNLVWPASPAAFADVDSPLLYVTLAVADGTLTAAPAAGVTLDGPATARMFIGTPAVLNSYFKTPGNIKYTPAANNTASRTLTTTVSDGMLSSSKTSTISITPVNDAPTVTVPGSFTVTEDVAGNLVWPSSPVAFADVDSPSLTVTLSVADGTLSASTVTGVTLGGTATARTFAGTAAALSSYFSTAGNIKYTPAANNTVARALTTTVSDGMLSSSKTSTISITPVNDAPTVTAPTSFTVSEDLASNLVWPASPAAFADVDSPSLTVTLSVADGTLSASTVTGVTLGGTATARTFAGTAAALSSYFSTAGNIKYTPAANNTVARALTTTVSDGTLSASKTSTISITPVNDAPTMIAPVSFTVTEDVAGNLVWPASPAAFADIDSLSLTVTLAVADGTLSAATVAGVTLGGTATARTFTGSPAVLNTYFKTAGNIKYTTAANNTVSRTLTTTVSDGTLSASKTSTILITPVNDAPTVYIPPMASMPSRTKKNISGEHIGVKAFWVFGDPEGDVLTATFTVDWRTGELTVRQLSKAQQTAAGVTINGGFAGSTITLVGTAAALNAFFTDAANVSYTDTVGGRRGTDRTLTATVSDGKLSSSAAIVLKVAGV